MRRAAATRPPRDLRRQPRDRVAGEHRAHPRPTSSSTCNLDIIEPYFVDEPIDFVYHFASPASPIDYLRLPLHTLKVGSYGTHHTLGLAKRHRARFLTASTSEVYGDPQVHPQPESYWGHVNPIGPRGVYDEAKRYAEALTMAYHRQQGVDTAIVRIFNTYGPRMRPHDGRAIPTFLRQALQDRPITVFGDGSQTRSFCYVDDLDPRDHRAGGVRLPRPGQHRQPQRVHAAGAGRGRDRGHRLEVADRLRGAADRRPAGPPARTSRLARELLGWEPEIQLREGLRADASSKSGREGADRRRPLSVERRVKRDAGGACIARYPRNFGERDTVTTCGDPGDQALLSVTIDHKEAIPEPD